MGVLLTLNDETLINQMLNNKNDTPMQQIYGIIQ